VYHLRVVHPELLAGRFRLGECIGRGGVSEVYAAVDEITGREVAVKLARAEHALAGSIRRRHELEAAALAVIASAQVVELISAGVTEDERAYLVLERLRGRNLQEVVDELGSIPPKRVAEWLGQAATALELAHGLGIVHRDLKPANLFLHAPPGATPTVKVLDFGMVVEVDAPADRGRDAFGGTPLYMAPEQVRGQLTRIGPETDVWAMAIVAVTLLTGEASWTGRTPDDVMREIESSPMTPPSARWPWLGEAFDAWFARSTRRVPERRFRDIGEQARQLALALRGITAPDRRSAAAALVAASTMSARTPTPVLVRLSGDHRPVVGREVECAEIGALLQPGTVVTLTGTAGIGKSCLARLVCSAVGEQYHDGAWFVPLGAGDEPGLVVAAIEAALDLSPDPTAAVIDGVAVQLAPRRVLLVLDGAEQVASAATDIDRLRRACPNASWLVTSRLPLGIEGERCVDVEPLELPGGAGAALTPGEAETFSAVELFVHRAREVDPAFRVDGDNVDDVVAICRLLDGFPHAIELAAAQLATSTPGQVRRQLAARSAGEGAAADQGGGSVASAVAWSYGLLAPADQAVLRALALFPAGLPVARADALLGHVSVEPAAAVRRLVQTRLASWAGDDQRRVVMLDTVRELCRGVSAGLGEDDALWRVAERHAEAVATRARTTGREAWLALVDAEHDNLRLVLERLLEQDPAAAMRLAGRLAWYWYLRGHYAEGSSWLEAAIARGGDAAAGEDLVRALHGAGRLALLRCRYERAAALLERARALAVRRGDLRGEAEAVQLLGSVARERGATDEALALHRRGLELWRRLGDAREAARAVNYLGFAAWLGGTPAEAPAAPAQVELRALGDPEVVVWSLLDEGAVAHYGGDGERARAALGRAFAESIAARFHEGIAWALNLIGLGSLERGELVQAQAQLAAALRVHRRLGDLWRCASALEALAAVAVAADRPARGALYLGVAEVLREQIQAPVPYCERALLERTVRRGAELIGDAFDAGRRRGRITPLEQVVALGREGL
jgi:non-specific serine/threonine protein kinase